jgi:hypothetical protein
MGTRSRRSPWAVLVVPLLLVVPTQGEASEFSAGVSLGWLQAGTVPRLAVGPHAGIAWPIQRDFLFTVHDLCTILPPTQEGGPGVYNQTSVDLGYAWKDGNVSAGPSVAFYLMPACGVTLCGRVGGLAVGGLRPSHRRVRRRTARGVGERQRGLGRSGQPGAPGLCVRRRCRWSCASME